MNSRNRKSTRRAKGRVTSSSSQGSNALMADPPQISTNIVVRHTYRFAASAAFSGAISPSKVLAALGTMGTVANTTVSFLFKCFRLRSLNLWAPPSSQGSTVTTSVEWLGTANSPNYEVSDTSVSVSRPAHVKAVPPKTSLASFWQVASGTALFNLVAPAGTIIDMSVDMIMVDQTSASTTIGAATVTLGEIYYLALDHGTSDLLVPVSLTTTV